MACFERVKEARKRISRYGTPYWVSEESGARIWDMLTVNFHHLLWKEKYPEWEDVDENIIIITQEEHYWAHQDINRVPTVRMRTAEMMTKHRTKYKNNAQSDHQTSEEG